MSHRRKRQEQRKLKRLYEKTRHSYGAGAVYDKDKNIYIRWYAPRVGKYFRRISNRKIRKMKCLPNGNSYKKAFDYWWTLY